MGKYQQKRQKASAVVPPPEVGKKPPTPEHLAMNIYDQLIAKVNRDNTKGLLSSKQTAQNMHDAVISAVAAGTHAQRFADALLLDLVAEESIDLAEKAALQKAAKILRGELDPRKIIPVTPAIIVPG